MDGGLNEKAADTHPADILAAYGQFSENPIQQKVKSVFLRRAGAA
jgi:hypothetical protein